MVSTYLAIRSLELIGEEFHGVTKCGTNIMAYIIDLDSVTFLGVDGVQPIPANVRHDIYFIVSFPLNSGHFNFDYCLIHNR